MTAALIFRGHSFRKPNDGYSARAHGIDWRKCIDSQRRFLIEPLRAKYGKIDVMLFTYGTEFDNQVHEDYGRGTFFHARPGATQRQTVIQALDATIECHRATPYDFVVVSRFDLEYLSTPWDQSGFDPDKINFLWREWNVESWDNHRRVPDAIHMMPGSLLEVFRHGVATTDSETCLHLVYWPLVRVMGSEEKINIMIREGFIDTNTDHCPNPIYRLVRV